MIGIEDVFKDLLWEVSLAAGDMILLQAGNQSARIRFRKRMKEIVLLVKKLKDMAQDYQKGDSDGEKERN